MEALRSIDLALSAVQWALSDELNLAARGFEGPVLAQAAVAARHVGTRLCGGLHLSAETQASAAPPVGGGGEGLGGKSRDLRAVLIPLPWEAITAILKCIVTAGARWQALQSMGEKVVSIAARVGLRCTIGPQTSASASALRALRGTSGGSLLHGGL
jgi:hypothetical protein